MWPGIQETIKCLFFYEPFLADLEQHNCLNYDLSNSVLWYMSLGSQAAVRETKIEIFTGAQQLIR